MKPISKTGFFLRQTAFSGVLKKAFAQSAKYEIFFFWFILKYDASFYVWNGEVYRNSGLIGRQEELRLCAQPPYLPLVPGVVNSLVASLVSPSVPASPLDSDYFAVKSKTPVDVLALPSTDPNTSLGSP